MSVNCFSVANDFQVTSLPVQLDLEANPPVLSDCVSFVVTDDSVFDPGEVFNVQLTTSTPYAIVRPTNSLAEVFIEDDDLGGFLTPENIIFTVCLYWSLQRFWLCIYLLVTLSMKTMELLRFVLL